MPSVTRQGFKSSFRAPGTRLWAIVSIICLITAGSIAAVHSFIPDHVSHWPAVFAFFVASIAAAFAWVTFNRTLNSLSAAIDTVTRRIDGGLDGEYSSKEVEHLHWTLPDLAAALDTLLEHTRGRLDDASSRATTDPVTTLANRLHFRDLVEPKLIEKGAGAILFIDLDRFKDINDKLGHAAGDNLLAEIADRLIVTAKDEGGPDGDAAIVGRLAGDEFTIFIPGQVDGERAMSAAHHVLAALRAPIDIAGQQLAMGASIGVAIAPKDGDQLTPLMKSADIAMYHAKEKGRSQAQLFTPELAAKEADRRRTIKDLSAALNAEQFSLALQPQIDLQSGAIIAVEALLRWNDDVRGVRTPSEFIEIAEDSGLIIEIGDWVTEAAASTLARWMVSGIDHRLTINISQRQIEQPHFLRGLSRALDRHDVDPSRLGLEITESTAMNCDDEVLEELAALRASGMCVAIDDFGTSSSNLARLQRLPVDRVKLDRTLIRNIAEDEGSRSVAASVIGLIHGLGFTTVAEGVEATEQLDLLRAMGCTAAQGYAICRPMDENAFLRWSAGRKQFAKTG